MLLNDMIQELWVARFEIIRSTSKYGKTYSKTYHISNFILYVLCRTPNLLFVTFSAKIKLLKISIWTTPFQIKIWDHATIPCSELNLFLGNCVMRCVQKLNIWVNGRNHRPNGKKGKHVALALLTVENSILIYISMACVCYCYT